MMNPVVETPFEKIVEKAYEEFKNELYIWTLKNGTQLAYVILRDISKEDALEIHFVAERPLWLHWGAIYKNSPKNWNLPPESLPAHSDKIGTVVMSPFVENKDLFDSTVFMVQYRLLHYIGKYKDILQALKFVLFEDREMNRKLEGKDTSEDFTVHINQ